MSELSQLAAYTGTSAKCPDCGLMLKGRNDGFFECVTEEHGPFRLSYERI